MILLTSIMVGLTGCSAPDPGDQVAADTRSPGVPSPSPAQDFNMAQTQASAGHCNRAIPLYLRAISKNNIYVNAYTGLASCYQSFGEFGAAILEYDRAIQIDPTNYGLYIARAGVEINNGSSGAAAIDDTEAMRIAPPQATTYVSIAQSFDTFQDYADAIKAYSKAIDLVPDSAALYEGRAAIYLQIPDYGRAYADYRRAIDVAPFAGARAAIYVDLANNGYAQQGDYNSAFSAIATAIRLTPANAHLYIISANIHRAAGALPASIQLDDRALRLVARGPDAEAAYEGNGDSLSQMGQGKAAAAAYREALALVGKDDAATRSRLQGKITALVTGQS